MDTDLNKSMTWEEAYQLASSWKLRHSQENLLDAVEKSDPSSSTYTRLKEEGVDNEEDDDTTEVEGRLFILCSCFLTYTSVPT